MAKVTAPPAKPDDLTLTIRLHDPIEKDDHELAAGWVTVRVARADLTMPTAGFLGRYVRPALKGIKALKLG